MSELAVVLDIANRLLGGTLDPVVRLRVLRDVLGRPESDEELRQAGVELENNTWVQQLVREQWDDGSWGRLHSQDASAAQKVPTTEVAVQRALALGLDRRHPVLRHAASYLASVLRERVECRDPMENNDRWRTGVMLFAAATLSDVDAQLPILDRVFSLWREIALRTFRTGSYSETAEVLAHRELTGATVQGSYLVLDSRYVLSLLGSRAHLLPASVEQSWIRWLWGKRDGIGYLREALPAPAEPGKAGSVDRWLTSHELLSRFPSWQVLARPAIEWLWSHRDTASAWDYGTRLSFTPALPLSESWRRKDARRTDWTTRVLCLLRRFYDDQEVRAPLDELDAVAPGEPQLGPRNVIRRVRQVHCKKGPERCAVCQEMNTGVIALLELRVPGSDGLQRRLIQIESMGSTAEWWEYEIVRVFASESAAQAYAAEHAVDDVQF